MPVTHTCWYCGIEIDDSTHSRQAYTRDHLIPICRGGTKVVSNTVTACRHCNLSKARRTLEEYREILSMKNPLYAVRRQISNALRFPLEIENYCEIV